MRNVTHEGRIVIFKALALLKVVFKSLIDIIPNRIISKLKSIQENLYGKTQIQK